MKILITVLLTCQILLSFGQKSETMERANAMHFPETGQLIVKFDVSADDKFQYQVSGKIPLQAIPKYFSYPTKNSNLEIQAFFVNPLKYRLTLKSRDSDDPNYKVESEFAATATAVIPSGAVPGGPGSPPPGLTFSILIPTWFDLLNQQPMPAGGPLTPDAKNVLTPLKIIEDFLAGSFIIGNYTRNFQDHLTESIAALEEASNYTSFNDRRKEAEEIRKYIQDFKDNLEQLLNDIALEMKRVQVITYTPDFTNATDNAIRLLKLQAREFTRVKFTLFDNYKALLDGLNKVSFSSSNIMLTNQYVELKAQKDLILNIIATPLTIDKSTFTVAEGDKKEIEFYVILRRPQVEASAGGAWILNGITFNAYSATADSTSFKLSNTETKKFLLPVLFLNVYRNASLSKEKTSEHLLILPQIGIGTGKELPTVLIGGGYVIPHKFFVSAGVLNAFSQELKKGYSLHGSLTGREADDISSVFEYKWVARFYFSVQFKL